MNPRVTDHPKLIVDADPRQPARGGVGVYGLAPDLMISLERCLQGGGLLQSILRVTVVRSQAPVGDALPDVFGRHQVVADGIRLTPHFPFEPGLSYRVSFDPRPLGRREVADLLTFEFSLPKEQSASPPAVKQIFPSSDRLPENLLRFYVCFSNPMQRGRVEAEISLLGPDGGTVPDALYRAPVELWDRSMRYLTILLDPGRLKRGVGPNRELGSPLKTGRVYTLVVGAGMTDLSGSRLPETFYKRFRVTDAVREPVAIDQWRIALPETNSRQPLVLMFPRPLDWALLSQTIGIASGCERSIDGRIKIDQRERRWSFTPASPWVAGSYEIRVASSLEDVCGNSVTAAFDGPLRCGGDFASEAASRSLPFDLV